MATPASQRTRLRRRSAWLRSVWAVAAGTATAVGLVCLWVQIGLAIALCLFVSLFVLALTAFWSTRSETGMGWPATLRMSFWSALAAVIVTGLGHVFGGFGIVAVALLAASSPWTVRALSRLRAKPPLRRRTPAAPVGVSADPELLDRQFRELVAELEREEPDGS